MNRVARSWAGLLARRLGRRGERIARGALTSAGFVVLAHNVRTPEGEVDVLALEGRVVVLVEVKTSARGPSPANRVRPRQRLRLRAAARWLAGRRGLSGRPWRADVVEVTFDGRRPLVTIRRGRLAAPAGGGGLTAPRAAPPGTGDAWTVPPST